MAQIPDKPIDVPIEITAVYHLKRNKDGSIPKVAPDLTNLLEATDDILVKYGIIRDDNCTIIVSHDGSRVLFDASPDSERTEITISEM